MPPQCKVTTRDNKEFLIPLKYVKQIDLLKDVLANDDDDQDTPQDDDVILGPVPLPRCDSIDFNFVLKYLELNDNEKFEGVHEPILWSLESTVPQETFRQFLQDKEPATLLSLRDCSNYLLMEKFKNLVMAVLTFKLIKCTMEECHQVLGIPDLSSEEREKHKEEFPWLFDREQVEICRQYD